MAHVVCAKLDFVTVLGQALGNGHNTGVGKQDIETLRLLVKDLDCLADTVKRHEVHLEDLDGWSIGDLCLDVVDGLLCFRVAASAQPDLLWAMLSKFEDGLLPETTIASSDDDNFAPQGRNVLVGVEAYTFA